MAKGIITCTGETINIGDTVETPDGSIITVRGAAVGFKFHNAELCKKVDHKPQGIMFKPIKPNDNPVTDCIIWGD